MGMEARHGVGYALGVAGLGCLRGGKVLFRQLDFTLMAGRVLVVTGDNGAGKSTLLRSLAGLLPWRAGQLHWCGQAMAARDPAYQQQLAYLGHVSGMSDVLSAEENLRFALRMMGEAWQPQRARQLLESLDLQHCTARLLGSLSQGQRRRLGLARVVLSQRPLWLLDEPDSSLDAQGCQWLGQALQAHVLQGGLAVVVSHRGLELPTGLQQPLRLSAPSPSPKESCAC